jgi:hypothetical protein
MIQRSLTINIILAIWRGGNARIIGPESFQIERFF